MAEQFIYTITTGRSGTAYLAALLKANLGVAEVHHERATWDGLGLHSPDASHFTRFNSVGVTEAITQFWTRKLALDRAADAPVYAEASHMLFKAGLVEHLHLLPEDARIDLVMLTRPEEDIAWSYLNRFEFTNYGYTWLFALDPRYPNVILPSDPYKSAGAMGFSLWYVREVFARAGYYRRLVAGDDRVRVHPVALSEIATTEGAAGLIGALNGPDEVRIPPRQNESRRRHFSDAARARLAELAAAIPCDADAAGVAFHDSGARLAHPARRAAALP